MPCRGEAVGGSAPEQKTEPTLNPFSGQSLPSSHLFIHEASQRYVSKKKKGTATAVLDASETSVSSSPTLRLIASRSRFCSQEEEIVATESVLETQPTLDERCRRGGVVVGG
ncbi:unnamed protein product [Boreogadus saida]